MHPLFKRRLTAAELDEHIKAELAESANLDPEIADVVLGSDEEQINLIRAGVSLVEEPTPPTRDMTKAESSSLEADLISFRLFGEPLDPVAELREPFRTMAEAQDRENLAKLTGKARAAQERDTEALVGQTLRRLNESDLVSHLPGRSHGSDPITDMVHKFLQSYRDGNDAGMRAVVRQLIAA